MTTTNVFMLPQIAYVLTDAAVWPRGGAVPMAFTYKGWLACDDRVFVTCQGLANIGPAVASVLDTVGMTIDELIDDDGWLLRRFYEKTGDRLAEIQYSDFTVWVLGWSPRSNRTEGMVMQCWHGRLDLHSMRGPQFGPYWGSPLNRSIMTEAAATGYDMDKVTALDFDPLRHGVILMEAQRRAILTEDLPSYIDVARPPAAGHIDLTTIGPHGIKRKTIHRWPDQIGKPVAVGSYADALARHQRIAGMSRQQRRAFEKQQRSQR